MVFDGATDMVTMHTDDGDLDSTLTPARASFIGMLRCSDLNGAQAPE